LIEDAGMSRKTLGALAGAIALVAAAADAFALCAPVAEVPGVRVFRTAVLPEGLPARDRVEVTYIGHSTFLIRTADGVTAATDYNDYFRAPIVPTIATMNRAHPNHYSSAPEPGIKHVLRGWKADGYAAHDLAERDLRVFNVPTNIRNWSSGTTDYAGNSMFVFETAGLCIAHLGHLHHTLTDEHLKRLGPIDIVLIAVDGAVTISQEGAVTVIDQIKPKVVIPMHYWGYGSLERFVALFEKTFPVKRSDSGTVVFSRATLPNKQLLILQGR
jgi:L-ascorbate metabolism protein UlaG (beta-lactamase superfamily)